MNALFACARKFALPLGLLLVLSGCATTYRFKVDAVRNQEVQDQKQAYAVVSANPEMDKEDLRFKEAEAYVKTALSSKGMYETPPGSEAQMTVEVDFGMEEPRTKYQTVSEPVYALVGGGTRTITVPVTDSKGNTRYVTYVVYDPPQRELIGFRDRIITYQVYEKYLRITARETPGQAGDRPPRELWSVYVVNEDEKDDLREYVPLMVSAAMDSINENASSKKDVVLTDSDERVVFVKKGL
ncbi:MAG TPA: hypothetical protein VGA56_25310 [Opitutaceae bacterium]